MDKLQAMRVFSEVVEQQSLSAAARRLNLSPSAISKYLAGLEDGLGVRLLNRTTRRLGLTEVGRAYYDRCRRILTDVEEAELAVHQAHATPRGILRLTGPSTFVQRHVAPYLPELLTRHPEVQIHLDVSDRIVDLVEEGFDLAIRIANLKDSSLIARRLAANRRMIAASPEYLARRGIPEVPDDLLQHDCITFLPGSPINDWHFHIDGEDKVIRPQAKLALNNGDVIMRAALAGGGLAMMAEFMAGEHVRAGRLVPVLAEYVREDVPIYAVYPHSRHLSPKVRVFVDFLVEKYGAQPYWECTECAA